MQQVTKLSPRLTLGQKALLRTPQAEAIVRDAVRRAVARMPWADRDEARALAEEALVLRVRTHRPDKGSLATYASDFVRGHVLRGLLKERASVPTIDALVRVLERGRPEHRSKARMEDAAAGRGEIRRRIERRMTLMLVEMVTASACVEERTPEALLMRRQERALLDRTLGDALAALPAELAEVMRLRLERGLTVAELAEAKDWSPRKAARRLAEALVLLRHALLAAGVVSLPDDA